jgi:outer membrane autotransporter protein
VRRKIRRYDCQWFQVVVWALAFVLAAISTQAADLTVNHGTTYTVTGNIAYDREFVNGVINQSGFTNIVNNFLNLDTGFPSGTTYNLSGGILATGSLYLGDNGFGTFNQSGGSNQAGSIGLGRAGGSGTYNLSGGSLSADREQIGLFAGYNFATFNQSGGINTVIALDLAGIYNLSGGTLSVVGLNILGGTFNQSDGNVVANSLGMEGGTYNQSGGNLSADYEGSMGIINQSGGSNRTTFLHLGGIWGDGVYNQSGGNTQVTNLILGDLTGPSGFFNLSGGSLVSTSQQIGLGATGVFNQSGGSNNPYLLIVGESVVNGPYLYPGVGTYNQSGGINNANYLILGVSGGSGTYNLSGGSLTAGQIDLNTGSIFNQTGGSLNAAVFNQLGGTVTGVLENRGMYNYFSGAFNGSLLNYGAVNVGAGTSFNVGGNYVQTPGGNLLLGNASPTSYGRISVTGTASLNGALTPVLLGARPQGNQVYAGVLTAAGGLTGTFGLTNPWISPTLSWQTRYSATSLDLLVQRNYSNPALSLNANQAAVGRMLNGVAGTTSGDLNTVLNALDSLPDAGAVAQAYQQISPDKAAALPILAFAGANLQKRTLSRRITDLRFGPGHTGSAGGLGAFNLGYTQGQGLMLASNSASLTGLLTGSRLAGASENPWGLYLDPALILGFQAASMNQTGFNYTIAGFNSGLDYRVADNLLVGLASGYSHTGAAFHGSGGAVEANTWPLTAYAAYLPQSFYAYGSLGYALNLFTLNRTINFSDLNRTAASAPAGNMFNAYAETGYDLKVHQLVLTPALSLAYSRLWVDGFTESGAGALNLNVGSQDAESFQTGLGGKIAIPIQRGETTVVPQIYAFYQHEFAQNSRTLDARPSQAGSTFPYQTAAPQRNFAVLGANFTLTARQNVKIQLDYNAEVGRGSTTAHYINGGLRYEF